MLDACPDVSCLDKHALRGSFAFKCIPRPAFLVAFYLWSHVLGERGIEQTMWKSILRARGLHEGVDIMKLYTVLNQLELATASALQDLDPCIA